MTSAPVRVAVVAPRNERGWLLGALQAEGTVVVGETDRSDRAAELVAANDAAVVVVDLGLAGDAGLHAIIEIMARVPRPVLALVPPEATTMTAGLDAGAVEAYRRPDRADPAAHAWLRDRVRSLRDVSILPRTAWPRAAGSQRRGSAPERGRSMAHPAGSDLRARSGPPPIAGMAGTPSTVGGVLGGLGEVRFHLIVSVRLAPELVDGYTAFLNRLTPMRVEAARVGSVLTPGVIHVASADRAVRVDGDLRVQQAAPGVQAADELFTSIAQAAGPKGVGVLLIGTGRDGPAGLRAIRRAGGAALVQDAAATTSSSLPDVRVMPLARIAGSLREAVSRAEV